MITKFAVTNYRGFKDRIELDLSTPNGYSYSTYAIKDNIVKDVVAEVCEEAYKGIKGKRNLQCPVR